ncbi:MAG: hypothetical protein MJY89_01830 [Bacteroidales bacterium]|nr:hypothetical protein [Bacteroidales bacterium]
MDRRKAVILFTAMLLSACPAMSRVPLMKFGIEWGISSNIFCNKQLNYITNDGYRIDGSESGMCFIANGHIMGSVGINASRHIDINLLSGYMGVSNSNRLIPVLLRLGYHFNGVENDGLFCFLDGGSGFHILREGEPARRPIAMTDAGMGYRFVLSSRTNVEFLFNVKGTFDTLSVADPNGSGYIPDKNIRKNEAFYLTLNLGVGINF